MQDFESMDWLLAKASQQKKDPILYVKKDKVSETVEYIGFSTNIDTTDATSDWLIALIQKVGTETTVRFASKDYTKRWDMRSTYFVPPAPDFSNGISTFFDGVNDNVEIASNPAELSFERTSPRSMSCWVKFAALGAASRTIASRHSGTRGWRFYHEGTTQRVRLHLQSAGANQIIVELNAALLINTWYHLAWTYDGSSLAAGVVLYVNGVAAASTVLNDNLTATMVASATHRPKFGCSGNVGAETNFLSGSIDEMAVYLVSLTGAQVSDIYGAGSPPDLAGLGSYASIFCWFRMGDGDTFPTVLCVPTGTIGTMLNMTVASFTTDVP
jgi:hypothetical protein